MTSQVALLKERLRLEADAVYQGLHGYAEVARHQIIHQKMERVVDTCKQLKHYIGDNEAALFMLNTMDQIEEKAE